MTTTEEKIKEIKELQIRIESLTQLHRLCEVGDAESEYKDNKGGYKANHFTELAVEAARWTGSDNPKLQKTISHQDDISLLVDFIKEPLALQIAKLTKELESKLN